MGAYFNNDVTIGLCKDDLFEDDIPVMRRAFAPVAAMLGLKSSAEIIAAVELVLDKLLVGYHQPHEELAMRFFAVALIKAAKAQESTEDLFGGSPTLGPKLERKVQRNHFLFKLLRELDDARHDQILRMLYDEKIAQDELVSLVKEIRNDIAVRRISNDGGLSLNM